MVKMRLFVPHNACGKKLENHKKGWLRGSLWFALLMRMSQYSFFRADRLRDHGTVAIINRFLESPWFILLICAMTALSSTLGLELILYTAFILLSIYIALFGNDFLPIAILVICSYISPSIANNPGQNPASVFYPQNGGIYLIVLLALFLICAVYRLIRDQEIGGKAFLKHPRKLLSGMVILGLGYILAGAFSGRYFSNGVMNPVFALLQFISVFLVYWLLSGAVRWDRVRPEYIGWVGLGAGLTVCFQLIVVFIANNVIRDSKILTGLIFSGWGNTNNIGCMIAMMIPFALFLARRTGKIVLFNTLAVLMVCFVCFTCSRTSMVAAFLAYGASMAVVLRDPGQRKTFLKFNGMILLILLILLIVFHKPLSLMFTELRDRGLNPRRRELVYPEGIRIFFENPIFGEGFYPSSDKIQEWSTVEKIKAVLPARWHNTVIQLLASCGLVGLLCYSVHRLQTIRLFWKKRNTDIIFIGFSLCSLLAMSLLDCHFFNIGPTLFYSMALAFAEHLKTEN